MQDYGKTKELQKAIGTWLYDYAESLHPFDEIKHRQTYNEIADVPNGTYDWKIQRGQRGKNESLVINEKQLLLVVF